MRLSSSTTRRWGASSERTPSFSGSAKATAVRSISALNEVIHLVALAVVDNEAEEAFGALTLNRRQGSERPTDAPRLKVDEAQRQCASGLGRVKEALAAIERAGLLFDEAAVDELLQHAPEALLGDLQDIEQVGNSHAGVAIDEVNDAMVRAAETVTEQRGIRVGDKIAVGKEEQFDEGDLGLLIDGNRRGHRGDSALATFCRRVAPLEIYVSHVDIFSVVWYLNDAGRERRTNPCGVASILAFSRNLNESAAPYRRLRCDAKGRQL